jgi:hypothetical protein
MSARIMIDLASIHPVFDGRWHRTKLTHFPAPGEQITTFCGVTEAAEFVTGRTDPPITTCWSCDLVYRRQNSIPYLPDHPGLQDSADVVPVQYRMRPRPYPR